MNRPRTFAWLPVAALLLLMLAISLPRLDMDGLWYDEVWSVYNAGGYPYEPLSPAGIWNRLATEDPDQGLAYPLMLAAWGAAVGWSEFATRYLSLLVGCLTVAGVYRLGRDTVAPRAGLFAALTLSVSAFFIYYTHELRVFTIVALSSALLLWCYWRIVYKLPSRGIKRYLPDVGFVIAGVGLTYTHYFAATMLIAVGLYHALFAPGNPISLIGSKLRAQHAAPLQASLQNRRWWRPVFLALIIGLLFVPWIPVFITSITRTATRDDVHAKSLAPLPLLETLFGYFANGIGIFALVVIAAGIAYGLSSRKHGIRFVAGIAMIAMLVIVLANAALQIIEPGRARYLIILWVPLALAAGLGIEAIGICLANTLPSSPEFGGGDTSQRSTVITAVLVAIWLINGILANFNPAFVTVFGGNPVPRWQAMTRILTHEGLPEDVFAFYAGERHYELKFSFDHAVKGLRVLTLITRALVEDEFKAEALTRIHQARRVWYGIDLREPVLEEHTTLQTILDDEFVLCAARYDSDTLKFSLYAKMVAFCPGGEAQIRFGTGITLTGVEPLPETANGMLTLPLGWTIAPDVPLDTYSVTVQVLDANGAVAAQGNDTGLPAGSFVTMQFDIDLSTLAPGAYDLDLIVYNWRTLERLPGTNVQTGESSDVPRLGHFRVEKN